MLHYLKAVKAANSDDDGKAIVAKMKEMPTDDPFFGKGYIRADGRKIHDMYLFEVKKPSESKGAVGLLQAARDIPAEEGLPPAQRRGAALGQRLDATSRCAAIRARRSLRKDVDDHFGIPSQALFGQLLLGLINGSFYAMLSLGLAVIFGLLNIINFAHGALYMMGAFAA